LCKRSVLLRVPLLDHAETAELPLHAVEVPVVIGVAGHEAVPAHAVERLDPFHDLTGNGSLVIHDFPAARSAW